MRVVTDGADTCQQTDRPSSLPLRVALAGGQSVSLPLRFALVAAPSSCRLSQRPASLSSPLLS